MRADSVLSRFRTVFSGGGGHSKFSEIGRVCSTFFHHPPRRKKSPVGMGAGGSKPSQVAAEPAGVHAEKSVTSKDFKKLQKEKLEAFVGSKLIFDMSCHYFNYMQETEGKALAKAMSANGVGFAALCGTSFKKTWVGENGTESKAPEHHLYDDGDMYYYSQTDGNMFRHIDAFRGDRRPRRHGLRHEPRRLLVRGRGAAPRGDIPSLMGFGEITHSRTTSTI